MSDTKIEKLNRGGGISVLQRRPDLAEVISRLARASLSKNTHRAIASDLRLFRAWCQENGVDDLPASVETLIAFVADLSGRREVSSLERYVSSIGKAHRIAGLPSPTKDDKVKTILAGVRKEKGKKAPNAKSAMTPELILRGMDAFAHSHATSVRDRAIVLVGVTTALRRDELSSLLIEDLTWTDDGATARLRKSKTDQFGEGRDVAIPRLDDTPEVCPIRALHAWLEAVGEDHGPLFRGLFKGGKIRKGRISTSEIAKITKRVAKAASLDPSKFSGHSLRAGYVTAARLAGFDWGTIMEQTGHRKVETVKRYMRDRLNPMKATRVGDIMRAAFATRAQDPDSFMRIGGGVLFKRIGLPPPSNDPIVLGQFSGSGAHQKLCSSAAKWLEANGRRWTSRGCHCAGGVADLATLDGTLFVEAGDTEAAKVVACLSAGQQVMIVPWGGVTGLILSGKPSKDDREEAMKSITERLDEGI